MASPVFIIPGLPNDLALLCLAWLPRRLEPHFCCVSRAWRDAFRSHALVAIRHRLGIQETRLFLCLWENASSKAPAPHFTWWLLDPTLCPHYDPLPSPPFHPGLCGDCTPLMGQSEVLLFTPLNHPTTGRISSFEEIRRLDVLRRSWRSPSPPNTLTCRKSYASAYLDGYYYVAGASRGEAFVDLIDYYENFRSLCPLKTVERLDCKTMSSWERLPDMHVARTEAKMVILSGCVCVIGGRDDSNNGIYSGEMWDPSSQLWVLVPELWPRHIFSCDKLCLCDVAVVMGTLFAIKHDHLCNEELMVYNSACKSWTSLGNIPYKSFDENEIGLAYLTPFGVGKELWAIVEEDEVRKGIFIIACSPLNATPSTLLWRLLPYSFHDLRLVTGLAITV